MRSASIVGAAGVLLVLSGLVGRAVGASDDDGATTSDTTTAAVVSTVAVDVTDAAVTTGPPGGIDKLSRGASLFRSKGCATCHIGPGTEPFASIGPSLLHVADRASDRVPGLDAESYLEQSMRDPSAYIAAGFGSSGAYSPQQGGRSPMPVLPLDDGEIDALVDYLLGR